MHDPITFRLAPQPAPTKPGWYYGRSSLEPKTDIHPLVVTWFDVSDGPAFDVATRLGDSLGAQLAGSAQKYPISLLDWFGPVPKMIEARVPA